MNAMNLSIPFLIGSICLSCFIPSGPKSSGRWEYDAYWDKAFYVYETHEHAIFEGESDGVGDFYVEGLGTFGAYLEDSDLQVGDEVILTFENRITQEEYAYNEEYGIESGGTREDSGMIIGID